LHEVSVIDVILNTGSDAKKYIQKEKSHNTILEPVFQYR